MYSARGGSSKIRKAQCMSSVRIGCLSRMSHRRSVPLGRGVSPRWWPRCQRRLRPFGDASLVPVAVSHRRRTASRGADHDLVGCDVSEIRQCFFFGADHMTWRLSAAARFRTADERYELLNTAIALWDGTFDFEPRRARKTGRATT